MKTNHRMFYGLIVATLVVAGLVIPPAIASEGLMTKEELKAMLDDPDLMVLDVRRGKDWKSSEFKIQGATYVKPEDYADWAGGLPKNKKYVLYCA